ncbi:hypothetical protein pb186bvf_008997 [Paramecium bursaria]
MTREIQEQNIKIFRKKNIFQMKLVIILQCQYHAIGSLLKLHMRIQKSLLVLISPLMYL